MLNETLLSSTLQSQFVAAGALLVDAQGNATNLKQSCDILSGAILTHIKSLGQVTINTPLIGTVIGVGGGVPGPVTGTATIPSGVLLPSCIQ